MHIPFDGWGVLVRPVRWFAQVPRFVWGVGGREMTERFFEEGLV